MTAPAAASSVENPRPIARQPSRPASYGEVTFRGLSFAGRSFGVSCAADGSTVLLDAPDDVEIAIL